MFFRVYNPKKTENYFVALIWQNRQQPCRSKTGLHFFQLNINVFLFTCINLSGRDLQACIKILKTPVADAVNVFTDLSVFQRSITHKLDKNRKFHLYSFFCLDASSPLSTSTKEPKNQGLQKALVAHAIAFFINFLPSLVFIPTIGSNSSIFTI